MAIGFGYCVVGDEEDAQINQMNAANCYAEAKSECLLAQADVQHRGANVGVGAIF